MPKAFNSSPSSSGVAKPLDAFVRFDPEGYKTNFFNAQTAASSTAPPYRANPTILTLFRGTPQVDDNAARLRPVGTRPSESANTVTPQQSESFNSLRGLNIGNPRLRLPALHAPAPGTKSQSSSELNYILNFYAAAATDVDSMVQKLQSAVAKHPELVKDDTRICLRLLSCNPAKILGPNFPRLALSFGVVMYRGMWIVCTGTGFHGLTSWIAILDAMSRAYGGRRPRLQMLSESMMRDKLGDIANRLFKAADKASYHVFAPPLSNCTQLQAAIDRHSHPDRSADARNSYPDQYQSAASSRRPSDAECLQESEVLFSALNLEDTSLPGWQNAAPLTTVGRIQGPLPQSDESIIRYAHESRGFAMGRYSVAQPPAPNFQHLTPEQLYQHRDYVAQSALEPLIGGAASSSRPMYSRGNLCVPASSRLGLRDVSHEHIMDLDAMQYFVLPPDVRSANDLLFTTFHRDEITGNETALIRAKTTGRFEIRKLVVLNIPAAVLFRELFVEMLMLPIPGRPTLLETFPLSDRDRDWTRKSDGNSILVVQFDVDQDALSAHAHVCPRLCEHYPAVTYFKIYVTDADILVLPICPSTGELISGYDQLDVRAFARILRIEPTVTGGCTVFSVDHCASVFFPDMMNDNLHIHVTYMLTRRVQNRKFERHGVLSGPVISIEHAVTQLGWQISNLFTDEDFLDRLCQSVEALSSIFEDPDLIYDDAEEQWHRSAYRTSVHAMFLKLWLARLRTVMTVHWSREIPPEHHILLQSFTSQAIAIVAQTEAWTSRPLLQCFDLVKFWDIFMDCSEQAFGECLLYCRMTRARADFASYDLHRLPGGIFHVDIAALDRNGFNINNLYIDTRVMLEGEKETGVELLEGQTPRNCPFRINWVCHDIPGMSLAQLYRPADGVHEIIKWGVLDIPYETLMKNMWIGLLCMPPHDWSEVISPRLYPSESFNVRYVKFHVSVPWFLRAAIRMPAEIVFRAERFDNMVVLQMNMGGLSEALLEDGSPNPAAWKKNISIKVY